jgi:hypothetical protein
VLELFKRMWAGWNVFARALMRAQSFVLMLVTWVVGIGPVAIALRLMGRDMLDRAPPDGKARTHWIARDGKPLDMQSAARRF